jgi:hypothetical protein
MGKIVSGETIVTSTIVLWLFRNWIYMLCETPGICWPQLRTIEPKLAIMENSKLKLTSTSNARKSHITMLNRHSDTNLNILAPVYPNNVRNYIRKILWIDIGSKCTLRGIALTLHYVYKRHIPNLPFCIDQNIYYLFMNYYFLLALLHVKSQYLFSNTKFIFLMQSDVTALRLGVWPRF